MMLKFKSIPTSKALRSVGLPFPTIEFLAGKVDISLAFRKSVIPSLLLGVLCQLKIFLSMSVTVEALGHRVTILVPLVAIVESAILLVSGCFGRMALKMNNLLTYMVYRCTLIVLGAGSCAPKRSCPLWNTKSAINPLYRV